MFIFQCTFIKYIEFESEAHKRWKNLKERVSRKNFNKRICEIGLKHSSIECFNLTLKKVGRLHLEN